MNDEGLTISFKGKAADIFRRLDDTGFVEVGIIGSDKAEDDEVTVAYYGSVHEFGDPKHNIPMRSFLRHPLQTYLKRYLSRNYAKIVGAMFKGEKEKVLHKLGNAAKNIVINSFKTRGVYGEWPELSEETIARKTVNGKVGDAPLIDTGALRQSIDYKVTLKREM